MSHTPSTFITGDVVGLDIADSGGSDNQFIDGAFSSRNAPHEFFVNAYEVQALNLTNTWSRALGTVPYVGQLKILDLSKSKPEANKLRGFWSGFAMRGPLDVSGEQVEYGVLVPYFDGEQYSSIAVRIDLARYHHAANNTGRAGAVAVLDLAKALEEAEEAAGATNEEATVQARRARGFARGFAHGAFAYFVPLYDGLRAGYVAF